VALAFIVDVHAGGNRNDLDQFGTQNLGGLAGCPILGIAGDPHWIEAVALSKRQEDRRGLCGVTVATVFAIYLVTDVTGELEDVFRVADPEFDGADLGAGAHMDHPEAVLRNVVPGRVPREPLLEDEPEFSVGQLPGVQEPKLIRLVVGSVGHRVR